MERRRCKWLARNITPPCRRIGARTFSYPNRPLSRTLHKKWTQRKGRKIVKLALYNVLSPKIKRDHSRRLRFPFAATSFSSTDWSEETCWVYGEKLTHQGSGRMKSPDEFFETEPRRLDRSAIWPRMTAPTANATNARGIARTSGWGRRSRSRTDSRLAGCLCKLSTS